MSEPLEFYIDGGRGCWLVWYGKVILVIDLHHFRVTCLVLISLSISFYTQQLIYGLNYCVATNVSP